MQIDMEKIELYNQNDKMFVYKHRLKQIKP